MLHIKSICDITPVFLVAVTAVSLTVGSCDRMHNPVTPIVADIQLSGQVYLSYGGNPGTLSVYISSSAGAESTLVGSDGRFNTILTLAHTDDELTVYIDATNPDQRSYLPSLAYVSRRNIPSQMKFILVPTEVTLSGGSFSGTRVSISMDKAFRTSPHTSGFYHETKQRGRGRCCNGTPWAPRVASWPSASMPIPVALDNASSTEPFTSIESNRVWHHLVKVETALGVDMFRSGTVQEASQNGIVVRLDDTGRAGTASFSSDVNLDINWGRMTFHPTKLRLPGSVIVEQEAFHVIGLGDTCSWLSIQAKRSFGCRLSSIITAADVAYQQILYQVLALKKSSGAQYHVDAAFRGERVIILGGLPYN